MVSLWGRTLANIFVGFHEKGILSRPKKLVVYLTYVVDTFCLFDSETEEELFSFP